MPTLGQNILHQFLSNMGELYCKAQLLQPLARSDHQCILFSPKGKFSPERKILPERESNIKICVVFVGLPVVDHMNDGIGCFGERVNEKCKKRSCY